MLDNMAHGGKIAMLGIPSEAMAIDWKKVIFNMITISASTAAMYDLVHDRR